MGNKEKEGVVHTPGEFQLDRKELGIDVGLANGLADGIIKKINNIDMNKNHKSDIAEVAPYAEKLLPFVAALAPLIEPEAITDWLTKSHPEFFKDVAAATKVIAEISALAAEGAEKLAPKEA